jgi:hypothetical protein
MVLGDNKKKQYQTDSNQGVIYEDGHQMGWRVFSDNSDPHECVWSG